MGIKSQLAFLFCLTSTIANAQTAPQLPSGFVQTNKPVICGPADVVLKGLADQEVNEKPIWIGKNEDRRSDWVLFVNGKTSGFTLIQLGQEVACIIGLGEKSKTLVDPT